MLSVIFVILTLALVMFLVFKKVNIVIASIIASIVLAVLDGQNVVTAMSETFMTLFLAVLRQRPVRQDDGEHRCCRRHRPGAGQSVG